MIAWKPKWTPPLFDMSYRAGLPPFEPNPESFLAVSSAAPGDRCHTLGIPTWVPTDLAIKTATARGWRVHGIWNPVPKKEALPKN